MNIAGRTRRLILITGLGLLLILAIYSVAIQVLTRVTEERVAAVLTTVQNSTLVGLLDWMDGAKEHVNAWAESRAIVAQVEQLTSNSEVSQSSSHAFLQASLSPITADTHFFGYAIISPENIVLASSGVEEIGTSSLLGQNTEHLDRVRSGISLVTTPIKRTDSEEAVPVILAAAPVRGSDQVVIAALVFFIDPSQDFSTILQRGRLLNSGETYAIDSDGVLVSESRFGEALRDIGLIGPEDASILSIQVRDPGVNLLTSQSPVSGDQRPLTRAAGSLVLGQSGMDVSGYRDYRGVEVVGAWIWNEEYNFGIITETDWDESFSNVESVRLALLSLGLLSGLALVGSVVVSSLADQKEQLEKARYELTVEGAREAILSFNSLNQITAWNAEAEHIFGRKKEEVLFKEIAHLILPKENQQFYLHQLEETRRNPQAFLNRERTELEMLRKDGSRFPVDVFLVPINIGRDQGFSAIIRDLTEVKEAYQQLKDSRDQLAIAYDETLRGWTAALDLRDNETEGHTQRVADAALRLAEALGVPEDEQVHLYRGALLHDIGKIGIPDQILQKPGPLDHKEWAVMKRHPVYAYEFLKQIPYLVPALDIPYSHHEKWDGSGYPNGLRGQDIPYFARMFALVDVWDALTSDRPYRKAWPVGKVREYILEQRGKHFDPELTDAFFASFL